MNDRWILRVFWIALFFLVTIPLAKATGGCANQAPFAPVGTSGGKVTRTIVALRPSGSALVGLPESGPVQMITISGSDLSESELILRDQCLPENKRLLSLLLPESLERITSRMVIFLKDSATVGQATCRQGNSWAEAHDIIKAKPIAADQPALSLKVIFLQGSGHILIDSNDELFEEASISSKALSSRMDLSPWSGIHNILLPLVGLLFTAFVSSKLTGSHVNKEND